MLSLGLCESPSLPPVDDAAAPVIADDAQIRPFWQRALSRRSLLRRSTRRLLFLLLIVFFLRTFIGEASIVPTASMESTILVGDHLFMNKLFYGPEIPLVHWRLPALKSVHRGDIVVFHYPKDPSETFLKRVAAVGGDQIEIRDGMLYVNARAVSEPYVVHHGPARSAHETMKPITVPQ